MSAPENSSPLCPRLIEVALPIREISAESVRDKSLRHGHVSTLHLWWARRPLAASRAVVFASLVPDPDDPRCPAEFRAAVERYLEKDVPQDLRYYRRGREIRRDDDPYRPYDELPDTLRNRLLTFIAKWSPESLAFEAGKSKKEPDPKFLLDDRSLVKWETSDPGNRQGQEVLRIARKLVSTAYDGKTPTVLDPFAGGGAIPLEAGRLGCQAIANDYNPVAYLILRATCEFPQKYGKPGTRKIAREEFGKIVEREVEVPNVLAHDVERWAKWILERAREKIGHLYPPGKDGRPVVGYLWARTAPCSNPSCRGEIPLLRSLLVCNKKDKRVALTLNVDKAQKTVRFGIAKDTDIRSADGTMQSRGNVRCPYCEQITPVTDLRAAGLSGKMGDRMVAVIVESRDGKDYRPVEATDLEAFKEATLIEGERPSELILPEINTDGAADDVSNSTGIRVHLYGMKTWGSLFNSRQLTALHAFVDSLRSTNESLGKEITDAQYLEAISTYMGLWLSKVADYWNSLCTWAPHGEYVGHAFSMQKLSMAWDYVETNPVGDSTGSAAGMFGWIKLVLDREQAYSGVQPAKVFLGNAANLKPMNGPVDLTVTDPPYFDAISYADLSDLFYVWLKRAVFGLISEDFATPQTPKQEEATALLHRHGGNLQVADAHFTSMLADSFEKAREKMSQEGLLTVMFAHQSTKAWSALINALFKAGQSIDATWPLDTELANRSRGIGSSALVSSITVACPSPCIRERCVF